MSAAALGLAMAQATGGDDSAALRLSDTDARAIVDRVQGGWPTAAPPALRLPRAMLRVAADGCGVIRTGFAGPPPGGLQWSVVDQDGFQVLGRNALGETHYRYYQSGVYTVRLQAWDGSKYAPVSNVVTIQC